jgi:phosphoglycerol transferase MdoB-like AlkP superfamily enzyme
MPNIPIILSSPSSSLPRAMSESATPEKSIGDIIDEAVGIRGPEDLLKMVLFGVSIAILVVWWFMSRMQKYTTEWWSLFGFECVAILLMLSTSYVVILVLPTVQNENTISDKDD